MRFGTRSLEEQECAAAAHWYGENACKMQGIPCRETARAHVRALCSEDGALCGVFCWGPAARAQEAWDAWEEEPETLDISACLRPDLTGHGWGYRAMRTAMRWLQGKTGARVFRVAVPALDARAQQVWRRLDFEPAAAHGSWLLMRLDATPWKDATRPLQEGMAVYPGDPPFSRRLFQRQAEDGWNASAIALSCHTGTHIDAPAHVGLAGTVEDIAPERLNGMVQLLDWDGQRWNNICAGRLLLRLHEKSLTPADARRLLALGVEWLGVDALTLDRGETSWETHRILLRAGVVVLENAAIEKGFEEGWYHMRCLPLLLPGSDGAPVRLLLRRETKR